METKPVQDRSSQLQKYLPVLHRCRDSVLSRFGERLDEMFEHVEPALLDFIDKAETNQSQFQFIDAISVVSRHKEVVKRRFLEEISRGFTEFGQGQPISYPVPLLDSQREATDSLELLDEDELNQRLALQNMVEKGESGSFHQLYALKQRLSLVRGGRKLNNQDIPGGPLHCASAFQSAAAEFGFGSNILLINYALFDKYVIRQLEPVYEEFNRILIEENIFPNLQLEISKQEASETEPPARRQAAGTAENKEQTTQGRESREAEGMDIPLGEELFNSIRELLASRRQGDPRYAHHPDYDPHPAPEGREQPMVDTPTLVSAIGAIQPEAPATFLPKPDKTGHLPSSVEIDMEMLEEIRQRLIQEREKLFQGVDPSEIPSADLDTIELVGMLFEHVLNEEDLPNIAKALISHLHTPYLKVAILDHHFLIDSRHIARRLLNLMVDAGRMWIEEQDLRRGIYYPMREHVDRILSEFKDNVPLFDEIYEQLSAQLEELEQKARVVEARAREAARGKERLERARTQAQRIIQERIGEQRLHSIIENFLNHAWLDKMILMQLRDPNVESTPAWQEVLGVVDDLVRVHRSRNDEQMRSALQELIPDLRQRIEEGLAAMGSFQPAPQALFDLLNTLTETGSAADLLPEPSAETGRQAPIGLSRSQPTPPVVLSDKERAMAEALRRVKFGTWFDLEDDNGKHHRLKLSWFSPVTSKYMFVDKSGVQALVTPIDKLAKQMCLGKARVVRYPTTPFVDRALKAVLHLLRPSAS